MSGGLDGSYRRAESVSFHCLVIIAVDEKKRPEKAGARVQVGWI